MAAAGAGCLLYSRTTSVALSPLFFPNFDARFFSHRVRYVGILLGASLLFKLRRRVRRASQCTRTVLYARAAHLKFIKLALRRDRESTDTGTECITAGENGSISRRRADHSVRVASP